jgi:hypothetical protein
VRFVNGVLDAIRKRLEADSATGHRAPGTGTPLAPKASSAGGRKPGAKPSRPQSSAPRDREPDR